MNASGTIIDNFVVYAAIDPTLSTNIQGEARLYLYPNPAHTSVYVHPSSSIKKIKVFSSSGVLEAEEKNVNTFSVSSLSRGIYSVQIETEHGITNLKLVIE